MQDPQSFPAFWYYMIAVQVCGILSTAIGFMYTWMRENRNRQWDLQDRNNARIETHGLINAAKTEAKAAFVEANHAKELISGIEEVRNNIQHKTLEVIQGVKEASGAAAKELAQIKDNTAQSAESLTKLATEPISTISIDRRKS